MIRKKDRKWLIRHHEIITEIPLPNAAGTTTTTILGLSAYHADMREIKSSWDKAFWYYMGEEYEDAEQELKKCEKYIEKRKSEDWKNH